MPSLPPFKRIITGFDHLGCAVVTHAGATPNVFHPATCPGAVLHDVWRASILPDHRYADDNKMYRSAVLRPESEESLLRIIDIPPDAELPGAFTAIVQTPCQASAESLDYCIVLMGEVWLHVGADQVCLVAGDVVVQRGTPYHWINRSGEPARIVMVAIALPDGGYQ